MLSARTQAIKDSLFAQPRQIDLERALLYTQSWKQTKGQPVVMSRALALRHILEQHEIVIDEYDLLVGNRTRTPRAGVLSPEMSPYWIVDELDAFPTRPQDRFEMSEQDKCRFKDELLSYWSGKSLNDWYQAHLSQQAADAQKTKIFSVAQTDKGQGHIIADIPAVLSRGFAALAADAHQRAAQDPSNEFYAAAAVCLDATIVYIQRYEQVCRTMATTAGEKRAQELLDMAEVLAHTNMFLDDTSNITIPEMKAKIRRINQDPAREDIGLVIIDYLQLMSTGKRTENRVQEISEITRNLKIMAKELNVPIIALSQLSRSAEKNRTDHRPVLSDLRDSGSIEQDADVVLFLYREAYYDNGEEADTSVAECIVAKNRHGEVGKVDLAWDGAHTRFTNVDYSHMQ